MSNNYRFSLEFYPKDRNGGLSLPLSNPDVQPAVEYAQFEVLKQNGQFPTKGSALFRPSYANGGPGLNGFAIEVPTGSGVYQAELPIDYFEDMAKDYRAALVSAGKLTAEEECKWAMSAWESEDGIECQTPALELKPELVASSLQEFLGRSEIACATNEAEPFKVFVPHDILKETADLAREASPKECGGVLLGNLHRDSGSGSGELFVAITAQAPAMKAVGSELELRFHPEAWEAVRAAVNLRKRGEIWCGWWHSHTPFAWADTCGQCPIERQRQCAYATRLFSASDRTLHRTVFARAFAIGVVANVLAANEVVHSCFGWRQGRIAARSYFVMEDR